MPYGQGTTTSRRGRVEAWPPRRSREQMGQGRWSTTSRASPHGWRPTPRPVWQTFDPTGVEPLRGIWAVDGSFVSVRTERKPPKEVAFVKTALLMLDKAKLDAIDKDLPHPLLLRDALKDSGVQHATVFPLKNVRTSIGTNYDAVRHIVCDSMQVDQGGAFYATLKWLAYQKWEPGSTAQVTWVSVPPLRATTLIDGLPHDADTEQCPHCGGEVFLTDVWGFHLDMDEDSAPESLASSYMLVMEHLMLFTAVRLMWHHTDRALVTDTLFIKDGPLTLRSQYSKLVPNIRAFLAAREDHWHARSHHWAREERRVLRPPGVDRSIRSAARRGEPLTYAPADPFVRAPGGLSLPRPLQPLWSQGPTGAKRCT